jgi:hypothetical protein
MKKKKSKRAGAGDVSGATIERWWANLSPSDKQFIYDIGRITDGFKAGLAGNVLPAQDGVEHAVGKLLKQVGAAYDKGAADWPKNPPEKRGLN